jgi:hypothetical protein
MWSLGFGDFLFEEVYKLLAAISVFLQINIETGLESGLLELFDLGRG